MQTEHSKHRSRRVQQHRQSKYGNLFRGFIYLLFQLEFSAFKFRSKDDNNNNHHNNNGNLSLWYYNVLPCWKPHIHSTFYEMFAIRFCRHWLISFLMKTISSCCKLWHVPSDRAYTYHRNINKRTFSILNRCFAHISYSMFYYSSIWNTIMSIFLSNKQKKRKKKYLTSSEMLCTWFILCEKRKEPLGAIDNSNSNVHPMNFDVAHKYFPSFWY